MPQDSRYSSLPSTRLTVPVVVLTALSAFFNCSLAWARTSSAASHRSSASSKVTLEDARATSAMLTS
jgi:hypothetical protein